MESTDQRTVQLTHETRYDAKGRSPAWYDKTCPYQLACDLTRIRDTFLLDDWQNKLFKILFKSLNYLLHSRLEKWYRPAPRMAPKKGRKSGIQK